MLSAVAELAKHTLYFKLDLKSLKNISNFYRRCRSLLSLESKKQFSSNLYSINIFRLRWKSLSKEKKNLDPLGQISNQWRTQTSMSCNFSSGNSFVKTASLVLCFNTHFKTFRKSIKGETTPLNTNFRKNSFFYILYLFLWFSDQMLKFSVSGELSPLVQHSNPPGLLPSSQSGGKKSGVLGAPLDTIWKTSQSAPALPEERF